MSEAMKKKVIGMLIILYTTAVLIIYAEWGGPNDKWDKSFETPQEILNYYYPNHELLYSYVTEEAVLYEIIDLDEEEWTRVPFILQNGLWKYPRRYSYKIHHINVEGVSDSYSAVEFRIKDIGQSFLIINHSLYIDEEIVELSDNQSSNFEMWVVAIDSSFTTGTANFYALIETSDDYVLYIDGEAFVLE